MCYNHLASQEEVTHALTHELIHAYDHCRAKDLDWCNCEHHACSEIRAASLSGDCNFKMELLRGHYNIAKQHQACVKRRALLSVSMNPYCQGKERQRQPLNGRLLRASTTLGRLTGDHSSVNNSVTRFAPTIFHPEGIWLSGRGVAHI